MAGLEILPRVHFGSFVSVLTSGLLSPDPRVPSGSNLTSGLFSPNSVSSVLLLVILLSVVLFVISLSAVALLASW